MPGPKPKNFPPIWWRPSLYDFVSPEMEVEGWVWEFLRRQRLKILLPKGQPVDAMNPNPATNYLEALNYGYYYAWPRAQSELKPVSQECLYYLSPSVTGPEGLIPKTFCTQYFRVQSFILDFKEIQNDFRTVKRPRRKQVTFKVDLYRPDAAIKRDFSKTLRAVREKYSAPQQTTPRPGAWARDGLLQVWDLRQYGVSWSVLAELSPLFDISQREMLKTELGIDCNTQSWFDMHRLMKAKYGFQEESSVPPKERFRYIAQRAKELIDKQGWYQVIIQHDSENIS